MEKLTNTNEIIFRLPRVWMEVATKEQHNHWYGTGRISGKTKNSVLVGTMFLIAKPNKDIVIARATYGSISDSMFSEFESAFYELPEHIAKQFDFKKSPLRIERKDGLGTIYFLGISSSEIGRTRGFHPLHKLSLVIIEETQQLNDYHELDDLRATLRRNFADDYKFCVLGNPPNIKNHWFNLEQEKKKYDSDWVVKNITFMDIYKFLNDFDKDEIAKESIFNEDNFKWLYLGQVLGSEGSVFPMFKRQIHLIPYKERQNHPFQQSFSLVGCLIGVDGSVVRDATALVPRLVFSNGQTIAAQIFYHDPKKDGVFSSSQLCENQIRRWFEDVQRENHLDGLPIAFVVDSASTDLIQMLRYHFGDRADVFPIKKSTQIQMCSVVQNAIAKNVCGIYDYGGYYNYTRNEWIPCDNLLAVQYENLIWNEKGTDLEPSIENDITDADKYNIFYYFRNTENLMWIDRVKNNMKDYYFVQNSVK